MSTATDMLARYLAAETAILGGQVYKWGDRQLTRADLSMVQTGRREWERKVNAENRGCGPVGVSLANLTGQPQAPEGGEFDYQWYRG
ncbi:hypothetical protein [Rhodanobacter thiooxydans]|jgi:hypothetical protein|uniref:hypothetical protein n=1 Tax=Rhodanobacter thiooxydans TaxID=416169 RepID=UPI000260DA38|nr:hypothetical protein [Rhodanobacter thiooxydans]EIL99137.1 hypothetical protein UUA_09026 [Rhodanobacter thiooxydans LCS2]